MDTGKHFGPGALVRDHAGATARIIAIDRGGSEELAVARIADGSQLAFPVSLLEQGDDMLVFPGDMHDMLAQTQQARPDHTGEQETVIPVLEEQLHAGKARVDTGRGVRITKRVDEVEEEVDLPLTADEYSIERVACDRLLPEGEVPVRREEGDTVILPVLEEVLVVQKRIRLREEIHITRRQREFQSPLSMRLRKEHVDVNHFDEGKKH